MGIKMTKIYVVDNGGQWTHREWRTLKYLDVDTKIIPNTTTIQQLHDFDTDGLILSGGAPRIGLESELGNCATYFKELTIPILGICAGHQYMARYYGGTVKPSKTPEFGKIQLTLIEPKNLLFNNVPETSIVWESHNDEITAIPESFLHLAKSNNCTYQAIAHKENPHFGLQFHPEVEHTEYGQQIFKNFITICAEQ